MNGATASSAPTDLRGLLEGLARARALERVLAAALAPSGDPGARSDAPASRAVVGPADPGERPTSPAVPAAWALVRRDDGEGDVFSIRAGSPAAALAFGIEPDLLLRQALGRASAPAAGRDPGGFPTDLRRGLLAPVPQPGTLVEVLAGVALAFRLRGEPRVALLVDDADGSASGFWHEGLNLAAVRRAPLVLVIDASQRRPLTARTDRLSLRAPAYGIEARTVSTGDPLDVYEAVREASDAARAGEGARMVEVTARPHDPFETLSGRLEWSGQLEEGEGPHMEERAHAEMRAALERVTAEPEPSPRDAFVAPGAGLATPRPPFEPPARAGGG